MNTLALTVFQGRAGDHNDLAIPGAASIGAHLAARFALVGTTIGSSERALDAGWKTELAAAMPALRSLASHFDAVFQLGAIPLTALTRCAASLATLPVVAQHRPDACIVWLDAHADLNTPQTSASGYLGGMALSGAAGLWNCGLGGDLDLANVVLVGLRDADPAEAALIAARSIRVVRPQHGFAVALREAIAGRPVYVHLDCDVLNPGVVPTDYRVEGGLSLGHLHAVSQFLAQGEIVGLEIAEFEHAWTPGGPPVSPDKLLDAVQPMIERMVGQP